MRFDACQLLGEAYSGDILNGLSVTNGLDNYLRRTSLDIRSTGLLASQGYGYDPPTGRLQTVSNGSNAATYSYVANSALIGQINYTQSGNTRMTASPQYDNTPGRPTLPPLPPHPNLNPTPNS